MIVVAIISVLAVIAIPNLLRARIAANEAAAIGAMNTISAACENYHSFYRTFPPYLNCLGNDTPPFIDSTLASGTKQGYLFTLVGSTHTFVAQARPVVFEKSGKRSFYIDEEGVIRFTDQQLEEFNLTPNNTDILE